MGPTENKSPLIQIRQQAINLINVQVLPTFMIPDGITMQQWYNNYTIIFR